MSDEPELSERTERAKARVEAEGGTFVDMRGETGKRGYSWPSFREGNTASMTHGAKSSRVVDPIAQQLVDDLLVERPDLERFPAALFAWARSEARCVVLEDWIARHGLDLASRGKATVGERLLLGSERLAMQLRESLGLTPRSEAQLAAESAAAARNVVDLDALRARGKKALEAGRLRGAGGRLQGDGGAS